MKTHGYHSFYLFLGDGNCAVHAILDQMTYDKEHKNLKLNHIEFRRLIANSLDENVRNEHIYWDIGARGCSIETWTKKYSREGCYVGEVFLRLASTFLNRKIELYPVNPYVVQENTITNDDPTTAKKIEIFPHNEHCGCKTSENNQMNIITLLYYEETYFASPHFQSIRPNAKNNNAKNYDLKIETVDDEIKIEAQIINHNQEIKKPTSISTKTPNQSDSDDPKEMTGSGTTANFLLNRKSDVTSTRGRGLSTDGNRQQIIMPRPQLLDDEDDGLSCRNCLKPFWYKSQLHDHLKYTHSIKDPEQYENEERAKKLRRLREEQHRMHLVQRGRGGGPGGPIIRRRGGTMIRGKYFIISQLSFVNFLIYLLTYSFSLRFHYIYHTPNHIFFRPGKSYV